MKKPAEKKIDNTGYRDQYQGERKKIKKDKKEREKKLLNEQIYCRKKIW